MDRLLSAEFMSRLEAVELQSHSIAAGRMKGDRRSARKGSSVEFADHRPYVMGDDLRHIDWNIFIRLDKLFLKLFEEEEDLQVTVALDASGSMDFGEPTKWATAQRIAAALAFVGLRNNDRLTLVTLAGGKADVSPAFRGRHLYPRVDAWLRGAKRDPGTDLAKSLRELAARRTGRGILVVVSDLMDKNGLEGALKWLGTLSGELYVVHLLAEEEVNPPVVGDLRLTDAEDGDETEVTISAGLLKQYRATLERFCQETREFCLKRGGQYLFATNGLAVEQLVLGALRRAGLVG